MITLRLNYDTLISAINYWTEGRRGREYLHHAAARPASCSKNTHNNNIIVMCSKENAIWIIGVERETPAPSDRVRDIQNTMIILCIFYTVYWANGIDILIFSDTSMLKYLYNIEVFVDKKIESKRIIIFLLHGKYIYNQKYLN